MSPPAVRLRAADLEGVLVHFLSLRLLAVLVQSVRPSRRRDHGMTTAEYAVGTIAACAFAAVLYKVVTSAAVSHLLSQIVTRALHAL